MFIDKEDQHNSLDIALFGNCQNNDGQDFVGDEVQLKKNKRNQNKEKKMNNRKKDLQKGLIPNEDKKCGRWSYEENKKYHWFLQLYSNHFLNKQLRRTDKIFKTMEIFLGTRQAEQCRSHHQKMQKKHKSFKNILLFLRNFHYGTECKEPIVQDFIKNQIQFVDDLVQAEYLHQQSEENHSDKSIVQNYQNQGVEKGQENKEVQNFFSDNFQQSMNFKDLI